MVSHSCSILTTLVSPKLGGQPSRKTFLRVSQFAWRAQLCNVPPPNMRDPARCCAAGFRREHDIMAKPRTLFDKIWQDHLVDVQADGTCLIYIDRHLVHEVTSPQAFAGPRQKIGKASGRASGGQNG